MALSLIVMLMFIALGIDMAKLMATRTQVQNAADAAALAGTAQGIGSRLAADTGQRQGIGYFDPPPNGCHGNGTRVITVPVTGPLEGKGNKCCYMLLRYGQSFLTWIPGSGNESVIDANFLGYSRASGSGGGNFRVWLIK